jgi:superfamily II DNA or RNA helicase
MLRPYQIEAVNAVNHTLLNNRSTLLVLPTGCGKTITAAEIIAQRSHLGPILFLAHRAELITQGAQAIQKHTSLEVGIEMGSRKVNPKHIPPVVVASVQTLARRLERFPKNTFSLIITDECHHAISPTYRKVFSHFSSSKLLGITATPDRQDKAPLADVYQTVAYQYAIRDAIDAGYLVPIAQETIKVPELDLTQVDVRCGDYVPEKLAKELTKQHILTRYARIILERTHTRPTVVFTSNVAHSKKMADMLNHYAGDTARSVDGTMGGNERSEIVDAYKCGQIKYLVNCALFTEGFDAPHTSCVAVARPTLSRALYTQMVGRGTRLAKDKRDCLVLDFTGNAGRHSLACPVDILGSALPNVVIKRAKGLLADGAVRSITDAIDLATEEYERGSVAYSSTGVDPLQTRVSRRSRNARAPSIRVEIDPVWCSLGQRVKRIWKSMF